MVKNKKMSKTSIAIIVLALLLVFSLVMGMTGAWFTQRESGANGSTINFGSITMTATPDSNMGVVYSDSRNVDQVLMPGDKINYKLTVQQGADQSFWYVVIAHVKIKKTSDADFTTVATVAPASSSDVKSSSTTAVEEGGEITLEGATYGNQYEGAQVTIDWEVRAIQKANVLVADAYYALVTHYDSTNFAAGTVATSAGE